MKARATLLLTLALVAPAALPADTVLNSMHNLSAGGPGSIKAAQENNACIFCHTVHGSVPKTPLWNRDSSGATYTPYSSSTTKAIIGQPTGSSKLCLSCHDGTVALGMLHNRPGGVRMRQNMTTLPRGRDNLGTDLSDDHPISFVYDASLAARDTQLQDPAALTARVRLDANHEMQCTTCHDPHDNQYGKFLVQNNSGSALCLTCHALNSWAGSAHAVSSATWNGQGRNPWPNTSAKTVAANGCENCHAPHTAGTKERLLTFAGPDNGCYVCHSGSVAKSNIRSEFSKYSAHPVDLTGDLHDAAEDPVNGPRHTTCVDCHNPHASSAAEPVAARARPGGTAAPMPRAGLKGLDAAGNLVTSVTREYQLCFRCHADSRGRGPAAVARMAPETNKRIQFAPANLSFHPVETVGKNPNVPSLIAPYTASSLISCTDCHNNDRGPGAGGGGPNGPHGSAYAPLLEREETLADYTPESAASYALCYKCHSRASILSDRSFPGHREHIVNYQTACTTCHDSHGVVANANLINFNASYVGPSPRGGVSYISGGPRHDNCTLTCHGSVHQSRSYDFGPGLLRAGIRLSVSR